MSTFLSLVFHHKKNLFFNFKLSLLTLLRTFPSSSSSLPPTGLYGIHHLKTPKGFQSFADEAIERSKELITYISTQPSVVVILRALDEISNAVHVVARSAHLCSYTHPDREFIEEASKASKRVQEYYRYVTLKRECHVLSEEAQRLIESFTVGIPLSPEKNNRLKMLRIEIAELCQEYNDNIAMDPGTVDIYPSTRIPEDLQYLVEPVYRSHGTLKEKGFRITTDPPTLASVLHYSSDDEVRKMAYVRGYSVPHANVDVLRRLISSRHELAQIMGFKSYADYVVSDNMASSSKVVMSFLLEMSKMTQAKAKEELKLLMKFKIEECGQCDGDLRPWDVHYYKTLMKSLTYKLNPSVIRSYFSLSNCIEGLKVLVQSLFGATFHNTPLAPGESWHPQVLKLTLHHPEEGDLGYLYLDLFSRKGKYPGSTHIEIKGGRRISETEYQLPVAAILCDFSGSTNLGHRDVVTLFHEFGHALHSLLTRTEYQHNSANGTVFDFAEIPSRLFEYYAWDYRVLKTFARHCSTGEPIPQKLVESLQGERDMFAATDLQEEIFYALVDQTLFGEQPLPHGDTSAVVAELTRKHTNHEHVEGTHLETRIHHLTKLGAEDYGYLYGRCFASTIWKKLCQENPLSEAVGFALRTKFLQHGASKDPHDLLSGLVGDDGIYRRCGDGGIMPEISSLCEELKLVQG